MRSTVFAILVVCALAIAMASPAKEKKPAPACSRDCGDRYEPICAAAKSGSKQRLLSFGNDCVMGNYNCLHADDQFEMKSKGECGGNVSVRLS